MIQKNIEKIMKIVTAAAAAISVMAMSAVSAEEYKTEEAVINWCPPEVRQISNYAEPY